MFLDFEKLIPNISSTLLLVIVVVSLTSSSLTLLFSYPSLLSYDMHL